MVGFDPLRRAAVGNKAAPLLGLWPACVLMRLNATGINNCSIQALAGLGCTNRRYVDLAYLLQKYSVSFSHYTVTPRANPNYSVETFYKEQLPTDLVQLDVLFQKARGEGINIQCWSINEKEISPHIVGELFFNSIG